jgi:putative transposase
MNTQKQEILEFVKMQCELGRGVSQVLAAMRISSSSYYRWLKEQNDNNCNEQNLRINPRKLSERERELILEVKAKNPSLRHRRIQGELQKEGLFISASSVYKTLKTRDKVEPYARRPSPWDEPHYEVMGANRMWGADWTKLKIDHKRWYLLTLIDFYSRLIVGFDIVSNVNASHIKNLYATGLSAQNIPLNWDKPALRADRGSPNTSRVTKAFFKDIEAELTLSRVKRPTDNAITERFYGTIKQEEIYIVESYPDLTSAKEEIGRYIEFYNNQRPHQSLWNFTPQMIHDLKNKTEALRMLKTIKQKTWTERKIYWQNQKKYSQKT